MEEKTAHGASHTESVKLRVGAPIMITRREKTLLEVLNKIRETYFFCVEERLGASVGEGLGTSV